MFLVSTVGVLVWIWRIDVLRCWGINLYLCLCFYLSGKSLTHYYKPARGSKSTTNYALNLEHFYALKGQNCLSQRFLRCETEIFLARKFCESWIVSFLFMNVPVICPWPPWNPSQFPLADCHSSSSRFPPDNLIICHFFLLTPGLTTPTRQSNSLQPTAELHFSTFLCFLSWFFTCGAYICSDQHFFKDNFSILEYCFVLTKLTWVTLMAGSQPCTMCWLS